MYNDLLKKFNLCIGETFIYKNNKYLVNSSGIFKRDSDGSWNIDTKLMADMLVGNVVKVKKWCPTDNERYYTYNTDSDKIIAHIWRNESIDNWRLNSGLVCRTVGEAEILGNRIINCLIKEV